MSDDVEHTPGPWQADVDHQPNETPLIIAHTKPEGNAYVVAEVNQNGLLKGDWKVNARIIAAAPELLEAAKQLLQAISAEAGTCAEVSPPVREQICSDARDAIAKAEGRHE